MVQKTYINALKYILLGILMYIPIFGYLDTLPIRLWDESRLAMNAYEMFYNGDFIVTHYEGEPDMWNTKPPLLIWIQVFFMKIFGINELAIRLPSAIAAFLTCAALLIFAIKYLKSFWLGFIIIFVLITSNGYISIHATRTGDYDALLTLFSTLSGLLFFAFCETKNKKYLYLFFLFTALAVLTKSVTGLLFLPAILVYGIVQKQFIPLLRNKHFYIGLFSFVVLVLGYYLLREVNNEGYIAAVQENELGGRYLNTLENHHNEFWYYYKNLVDFQLSVWYLFIPCGLVTGLFIRNKKINRLTLFCSLMVLSLFLVISTSQTKLAWYDVPLYPFLAIIIAIFTYCVFLFLKEETASTWIGKTFRGNVVPFIFLLLIGITPYQKIIDKTYKPKEYNLDYEFYELSYYLKDAVKGKRDLNNHSVIYDLPSTHLLFYVKVLNDKGIQIQLEDWTKLKPMDLVIAQQGSMKQYVEDHYEYEVIQEVGNVITYKIHGNKHV